MNWLGLVFAVVAIVALITAIVFLYTHRKGDDKPKPDPPPNLNGRARERRDRGAHDEKPGGPYRRRRVVPGSWEAKK